MESFSHVVNEYAREAISDGIDEYTIMGIVHEKMSKAKSLEIPLTLFRMRPKDDPERCWKGLLRVIHEKVEQERNDRLRAERTAGVDKLMRGGSRPHRRDPNGVSAAPAPHAPPQSGLPQANEPGKGQQKGSSDPLRVC